MKSMEFFEEFTCLTEFHIDWFGYGKGWMNVKESLDAYFSGSILSKITIRASGKRAMNSIFLQWRNFLKDKLLASRYACWWTKEPMI